MKLNTKIRYGLRAMIELAMQSGNTGLYQKAIAERQGIPLKFLDKIISDLKSAELIINAGGKRSGYVLARNPEKISVYDIFRAFEGSLCIIECLNPNPVCCRNDNCASQDFWMHMNLHMEAVMTSKTLAVLAADQIKLNAAKVKNLDFQI